MDDAADRPGGTLTGRSEATGRLKAWQCIGCGKIEAPQNCIGVCEDRAIEFVYAGEDDKAIGELQFARQYISAVNALVRQIANVTPRAGEWERSYRALQGEARRLLIILPRQTS